MIAFWEYLKREHQLSNAENILRYLCAVKPADFRNWRYWQNVCDYLLKDNMPEMNSGGAIQC